ncbi:MAG TPA: aldo/keto reductase [Gemmatimonadaceae bacterium]|nr:aldo/keto reductase [Gemmatimonadaceae bacterium]
MLSRSIPSTGEQLPVIGLGTWRTFDVGRDEPARESLAEVLAEFVRLGGKVVDSSPMYGSAETVVGDLVAAAGVGDQVFLATKVWTTGKTKGVAEMEDSMRKLRAERVDLMQVHNLVDVATHLRTLAEWKSAGRVRYVGITHYTTSAHEKVAKLLQSHASIDFVQINYSAAEREAEKRVLPVARDRGVAVIVNRPFAEGGLLRRLARAPLPPFAAEIGCTSWSQLLLKFIVSHPAVTCAIPATSDVEHLRDNMGAGEGALPDEEMRRRIVEAVVR